MRLCCAGTFYSELRRESLLVGPLFAQRRGRDGLRCVFRHGCAGKFSLETRRLVALSLEQQPHLAHQLLLKENKIRQRATMSAKNTLFAASDAASSLARSSSRSLLAAASSRRSPATASEVARSDSRRQDACFCEWLAEKHLQLLCSPRARAGLRLAQQPGPRGPLEEPRHDRPEQKD